MSQLFPFDSNDFQNLPATPCDMNATWNRRSNLRGTAALHINRAISAVTVPATDWEGACERIEEIIVTLTTCYVRKGFELDRIKASGALTYCRCVANGAPEDDAGFQRFLDFAREYNQSIDWIIRGDMRCMITDLAAAKY